MTLSRSLFFVALPLLAASSAVAQHETFKVDPDKSDVAMTLGASDHATHGTFHVSNGLIEFEPKAATIGGSVVVSAGSGKTGNDSRDKKMINEVLDAPHFADVTFAPHSYQGSLAASGDSTVQVAGTFTLHVTAHEITVPMQVHIDSGHATAKTHFDVPYVKWGLKDPSIFILKVAKDVTIDLTLTGSVASS